MASSAKQFSALLFLFTISFSVLVHGRDSQFFSKVTSTSANNGQETLVVPNKEESTFNKQAQEEPVATAETQSGYGLYGHESGQLPPTATKTTATVTPHEPFKKFNPNTQAHEPFNKFGPNTKAYEPLDKFEPDAKAYEPLDNFEPNEIDPNSNTNLNDLYKNDAFVSDQPQGMSDTRRSENSFSGGNGVYNLKEQQGYTTPVNNYNNGGNLYNSEKQGVSDTKFMARGYTTPISSENSYSRGNGMYNLKEQQGYTTPVNSYNDGSSLYNSEKQGNSYSGGNGMYNLKEQQGYTTPVNSYNNGGSLYNSEKQGISDNSYSGGNGMYNLKEQQGYTTPVNQYNNGGSLYNPEKHGMSDTRFLENGKYYYELDSEKYNFNANANSMGFKSRDQYFPTNQGRYGNGENNEFNNGNSYQEEFQESQAGQYIPDQYNP